MTTYELQRIDEHYAHFKLFGYTFRWFSTTPRKVHDHVLRAEQGRWVKRKRLLIVRRANTLPKKMDVYYHNADLEKLGYHVLAECYTEADRELILKALNNRKKP